MGFYFGNPVSKIDQEKKTCQNILLDKLQLNVDPKENREQMKQNASEDNQSKAKTVPNVDQNATKIDPKRRWDPKLDLLCDQMRPNVHQNAT